MNSMLFRRTLTLTVAGALAACAPPTMGTAGSGDMAKTAPPRGVGGGPTTSTGDMATAPAPNPNPNPNPSPSATLPFTVDSVFVSSGFMGDGAMAGSVTMSPAKMGDSTDCGGKRSSATAVGECHTVNYVPPAANGMGWAGVYWQYPANNWGMKAGFVMPAGAKKVTFQAMGSKGGEKVKFLAGGIISPSNPYTDSIKADNTIVLTSSWAQYSIDLSGQTYSSVLGGFGWTMAASDVAASSGTFFVDDIQWQ